jgi:hypothetical protein
MAEPTNTYTVLRPICMEGQRVEIGEAVDLTVVQYAELSNAGKVGPFVEAKRSRKKAAEPAAPAPAEPVAADPAPETPPTEGAAA